MASPTNVSFVITLVHGTWARGAAWTQLDSPFSNQLREELKNRHATTVKFFRHEWCGTNTHQDRRKASICLRKQLLKQCRELPNARHYIVGHSHGGNVALRAVHHSPTLRRKIGGIVTIATPFLSFTPNNFRLALVPPTLRKAASIVVNCLEESWNAVRVLIVPFILLLLMCMHWILRGARPEDYALGMAIERVYQAAWFAGFTVFVLVRGWTAAQAKFTELLKAHRFRVFRRYSYFQPDARLGDLHVLVLSSLIDEAYSALAGSWWMHRVAGWGVRLGICSAIVLAVSLSAAVAYGLNVAREILVRETIFHELILAQFIDGFLGLICSAFFITLAYRLVHFFLKISGRASPGLGLASPNDNLLWDVRAQRTLPAPICTTTNKRYGFWQLIWYAKGAWFHSRIYSYPLAIKDIAKWMSSEG
jgi:hypothetical protein